MKYVAPMLGFGIIIILVIWFTGCGMTTKQEHRDLLALEVDEQRIEVSELRTLADTLTNVRARMLDDLRNLQELNRLTPEQITVLEAESPPVGDNMFAKIGKGLKRLWPF